MLIGISSSQGAGKSTVISKLDELGYSTVKRKTSRSILSDWNITLDQVNSDPVLAMKFQEEILQRKYEDDTMTLNTAQLVSCNPIVFSERTFLDLFCYALVALGSTNSCSDWLDDYYRKCMKAQQIYDKVYYLTAGHFKPEHDGVRGSNSHYSRMVDIVMFDYYKQMTQPARQCVIDTPNFKDRIAIITSHNPL
jgi:predicted ATPase